MPGDFPTWDSSDVVVDGDIALVAPGILCSCSSHRHHGTGIECIALLS